LIVRYIIYESENLDLDIKKLEEGYDYRTKLPNPFKTYFNESSEKIKKQAVEQIVGSIMTEKRKNNTINIQNIKDNNKDNSKDINKDNMKDMKDMKNEEEILKQYLNSTFSTNNNNVNTNNNYNNTNTLNTFTNTKAGFDTFMKFFKESCDYHNLITIDQKIDYFVHLKSSELMNPRKATTRSKLLL
jgi:hypothetical protein